jgi:hypothetical protein
MDVRMRAVAKAGGLTVSALIVCALTEYLQNA